ncbi:MAG: MFS transporter, partial [Burkholderiales bacterium]
DPLIDLRLFKSPVFSAALINYLFATFVAFNTFVFTAQYLQLVLGLSPLQAGLWTVPMMIAFIVGSNLVPIIVRRVGPEIVICAGLVLSAIGFVALTQVDSALGLARASVVFSFGQAPVFTLTTDMIISAAPPDRAGAASAISETSSEFGGALGIAVLGSIGTAVYRRTVADTMPSGIPAEAMEVARNTLGGAVAAAEKLANPVSEQLLAVSREAFVHSFVIAAVICAVISIVMAIVTAVMLPRSRTGIPRDSADQQRADG